MTTEEMTPENVGRAARVWLNQAFDDARCTFRAWSRDHKEVFVTLNSQYGKAFKSGELIRIAADAVRLEKAEGSKQKAVGRKNQEAHGN
jgi:hypothetical protein